MVDAEEEGDAFRGNAQAHSPRMLVMAGFPTWGDLLSVEMPNAECAAPTMMLFVDREKTWWVYEGRGTATGYDAYKMQSAKTLCGLRALL